MYALSPSLARLTSCCLIFARSSQQIRVFGNNLRVSFTESSNPELTILAWSVSLIRNGISCGGKWTVAAYCTRCRLQKTSWRKQSLHSSELWRYHRMHGICMWSPGFMGWTFILAASRMVLAARQETAAWFAHQSFHEPSGRRVKPAFALHAPPAPRLNKQTNGIFGFYGAGRLSMHDERSAQALEPSNQLHGSILFTRPGWENCAIVHYRPWLWFALWSSR